MVFNITRFGNLGFSLGITYEGEGVTSPIYRTRSMERAPANADFLNTAGLEKRGKQLQEGLETRAS